MGDDKTPPAERKPWNSWPRWRRRFVEIAILAGIITAMQLWQRRNLLDAGGEVPPPLALRDLSGAEVRLSDFAGKRIQLHFWATWCSVCQLEHGALNAVQTSLDDDQVLLTVVADGEDPEKIAAYIAKEGLKYPVLLGDRSTLEAWKISSFPTNYFIGTDGLLQGRDVGMSSRLGMRARLGCAR